MEFIIEYWIRIWIRHIFLPKQPLGRSKILFNFCIIASVSVSNSTTYSDNKYWSGLIKPLLAMGYLSSRPDKRKYAIGLIVHHEKRFTNGEYRQIDDMKCFWFEQSLGMGRGLIRWPKEILSFILLLYLSLDKIDLPCKQ